MDPHPSPGSGTYASHQRFLAAVASFVGASIVACQSQEATEPHDIRALASGPGTAADANKGQEAKCDTILITAPTFTIAVGGIVQFTANVQSKNDKLVTKATVAWSSFNPSVAAVNSSGIVTGVSTGSTIIRATCTGSPGLGDGQINVQ
jgi:hypothetical protein